MVTLSRSTVVLYILIESFKRIVYREDLVGFQMKGGVPNRRLREGANSNWHSPNDWTVEKGKGTQDAIDRIRALLSFPSPCASSPFLRARITGAS
jgi:hypothetical protein